MDYEYYQAISGVSTSYSFFYLLITVATVAAMWLLFKKAGEEGWAAIIPFYNLYVLFKITWGSGWKFLLLLIPIANIVIMIITWVKLAKVFGKGGGYACGLIFLNTIFICIMGFDKNIQYVGIPGAEPNYRNPGNQQNNYNNPYNQGYQNPYSNGYQQNTGANGTKYCSSCGEPLDLNTKFCSRCGKEQ